MIAITRIWAVFLRILYNTLRDINRYFDFFYWPLVDALTFGFIGVWLTTQQEANMLLTLMVGLALWQVTYRTNIEVSRSLLQELWDNNMINTLATPLTPLELLLGYMLTGLIFLIITVPVATILVLTIYGQNIWIVGLPLVLFILLLAMSGWILGLLGACCIIRWGRSIEVMVWAMGWLLAPFCSVYYPAEVLPQWAQTIGSTMPMSYVFKAMRGLVLEHHLRLDYLAVGLVLNLAYLAVSAALFSYMLNQRKKLGLGGLR